MINDAYLVDMLSNFNNGGILQEGAAMRRVTAVSVLDSLPFDPGSKLPSNSNWTYYQTKGLYELKDNTPLTMLYFTQKQLDQAQITNDDFRIISGGVTRISNDAHLFGIKIIKRDITCKNGYLNVLERVLVPPVNMAQYVSTNTNTTVFSSLLEQFSAPFFDAGNTILYRQLHPAFSDSIFTKKYFAYPSGGSNSGGSTRYPSGLSVPT